MSFGLFVFFMLKVIFNFLNVEEVGYDLLFVFYIVGRDYGFLNIRRGDI